MVTLLLELIYHFNYDLIADLFHHNLQCCLNASTITTEILDTLYNQKSLSKVYFVITIIPDLIQV